MKRTLFLTVIALMALATVAGAQLMGNGHYWYSGDGGIPKYTPADVLDGDISDMKANGYHLWWGMSDVFSWGDTYGYSVDTNLEGARLVVRAFDLDNNLYCAEGEDPAECGTDADIYLHYWYTWDENAMYIAGDVIDNHYDVIQGPDDPDWAFWKRDHYWMSVDLTGIGTESGTTQPHYHSYPMKMDEAVYTQQIHWSIEGEATEIMYGDDPDFFQGSTTDGGPSADGYWFMTKATWDLLFTFAPELQGNVGDGWKFKMRHIIPDPDGDDAYGQTFFGVDYTTNAADYGTAYWPDYMLQQGLSQTAVSESSWGNVKQLHR
jgi:hypothetical protein